MITGNQRRAQVRHDHHERQHQHGDQRLPDGPAVIDDVRPPRDEVGQEQNQRRLGEFRRLERSHAAQLEPAMRARIGEIHDHQQPSTIPSPENAHAGVFMRR